VSRPRNSRYIAGGLIEDEDEDEDEHEDEDPNFGV
jgi:hypothetical protein